MRNNYVLIILPSQINPHALPIHQALRYLAPFPWVRAACRPAPAAPPAWPPSTPSAHARTSRPSHMGQPRPLSSHSVHVAVVKHMGRTATLHSITCRRRLVTTLCACQLTNQGPTLQALFPFIKVTDSTLVVDLLRMFFRHTAPDTTPACDMYRASCVI